VRECLTGSPLLLTWLVQDQPGCRAFQHTHKHTHTCRNSCLPTFKNTNIWQRSTTGYAPCSCSQAQDPPLHSLSPSKGPTFQAPVPQDTPPTHTHLCQLYTHTHTSPGRPHPSAAPSSSARASAGSRGRPAMVRPSAVMPPSMSSASNTYSWRNASHRDACRATAAAAAAAHGHRHQHSAAVRPPGRLTAMQTNQ
jgi:hypothetical protein